MTNVIPELGAPLSPKQIYFTITEDISLKYMLEQRTFLVRVGDRFSSPCVHCEFTLPLLEIKLPQDCDYVFTSI